MNKEELIEKAYDVRKNVLRMGHVDKRGFIAQSLGAADFLTVLYFHAMKYHADDPKWEGRDRFLLSAGHNAIAVYAAMAEAGFFPKDWLDAYGLDNSRLPMSCMPAYTPGIEISGGSIGLGMPIAVGMAMGLKRKGSDSKVYVMMGDGEMAEGPTWEAAMSAAKYHLDNLCAVVDVNGLQIDGATRDVMNSEPLDHKMDAFGFNTIVCNGNSFADLEQAFKMFDLSHGSGKPTCFLLRTTKGLGVSFMENSVGWHGKAPNDDEYAQAMSELRAAHASLEKEIEFNNG